MFWLQGETPKQRAEKANDQELADYLENRQHYQMIQREDQETAVWGLPGPSEPSAASLGLTVVLLPRVAEETLQTATSEFVLTRRA